MNNKGFTLIELLVTIVLLSLISIISVVSINSIIEESKINECESLVINIKGAAKEYFSVAGSSNVSVPVSDLITNDYLTGTVTNPFTGDEIDPSNIIVVGTLNDDYTVSDLKVIRSVADAAGNYDVTCEDGIW